MLTGGMILSSILTFLFGSVGPWLEIYNVYYYAIIWGINGLLIILLSTVHALESLHKHVHVQYYVHIVLFDPQ